VSEVWSKHQSSVRSGYQIVLFRGIIHYFSSPANANGKELQVEVGTERRGSGSGV